MVETIDITQLQQRMDFHPNMAAADSLLDKVHLLSVTGLQGSSRALFAASLFRRAPRNYLYILNDAESEEYSIHPQIWTGQTSEQRDRHKEIRCCFRIWIHSWRGLLRKGGR